MKASRAKAEILKRPPARRVTATKSKEFGINSLFAIRDVRVIYLYAASVMEAWWYRAERAELESFTWFITNPSTLARAFDSASEASATKGTVADPARATINTPSTEAANCRLSGIPSTGGPSITTRSNLS